MTTEEFTIKIPFCQCTLKKRGILCLAYECYSTSYKQTRQSYTLVFKKKEHAEAFNELINFHIVSLVE